MANLTRRSSILLLSTAALAAAGEKPAATLKYLPGDDKDGALLQTRVEITPTMIERLKAVRGIEYAVATSRYEAVLYRGARFTWPELEGAILRAVTEGK